ncbi:MAG: AAA family ATPase [Desulfotignum sp.]|jgi:aminoglycoside phosphotransferase family enzyme/predicted kinase|nr:AAA family ATPase [Desulfotignum sp.]
MDNRKQTDDHGTLVAAMASADFYPHKPTEIIHKQTHISDVFIAGDLVYKVKKPVNMGFLDFSTREKRHECCCEEVRLNQRLTTDIYLGVEKITWDKQGYGLNRSGQTVDYAVKMRRLPDENTLESLLVSNRVTESFIDRLIHTLSDFYKTSALNKKEMEQFGSFSAIEQKCRDNFSHLPDFSDTGAGKRKMQLIKAATRMYLDRHKDLFDRRIENNHICDTHGDLKTEHVYQYQGVQILDCIEFNHAFRYQDTASDLAFLAMDMDFLGYRPAALYLLSRYVEITSDADLMQVIDFYKCFRAMVQVKVYHLQIETIPSHDDAKKAKHIHEMEQYLDLAYQYALKTAFPVIWVTCGMIAAGKSTVAEKMAALFSIPWIRSDDIRKTLFADLPDKSGKAGFEKGMYTPEATSLVYGKMLVTAQAALEKGRSVILDATCSRQKERQDILQLARDTSANIIFVECRCPDREIKSRLKNREHQSTVSDARLEHFAAIKQRMDPFDHLSTDVHMPVRTDQSLDSIIETILTGEHELLARQVAQKAR